MSKVELLAPAGDYDCFLAAVKAGADAVYLGGNFSARAYAKNFSDEEILSALDYAHFHNRKVYMTLNIVMKDDEIITIAEYLKPFYEAGLDGVIVQDIGLIAYIKKYFPLLPVHASTQMTITDSEGAIFLNKMGINRVVLARELSLSEIRSIHNKCDAELECFIHGALCYSYSGKCLMSSFIGGRSGNRGRCAGTCRLPFDGEYPISCKDLCTINIIPKLIAAGITSFKIEGRMKSAEYVAGVVGIYRKYIDMYYSNTDYIVDRNDLNTLLKLYTRSGNCEGYYFSRNGRNMITLDMPGYAKADEELSRNTYELYTSSDISRPVNMSFIMHRNMPVSLSASCGDYKVTVTGDNAQEALSRPLTKEDINKQLGRLGGTEFAAGQIDIDVEEGLFMPVGKLNEIRRSALNSLKEEILSPYKRVCSEISNDSHNISKSDEPERSDISIHVYAKTINQATSALKTGRCGMISIDFWELKSKYNDFMNLISNDEGADIPFIYVIMPYVVRNGFTERYSEFIDTILNDNRIKGVIVDNYELLYYIKSLNYSGNIITDLHMYALNHEASDTLRSYGIKMNTTPIELNKAELLRRNIPGEDMIVYGYIPLMVSAQCVHNTRVGCDKSYSSHILKDRYGKEFTAVSECGDCNSILYNCVPVSLHKDIDIIRRLGPCSIRLMFTMEDETTVNDVVCGFSELILHDTAYNPVYEYTRGHLLRGVE